MPILDATYRYGNDHFMVTQDVDEATASDTVINDKENIVWRQSGRTLREIDLSSEKRERVIQTMEEQFFASPLAKRILTWWVDFIIGRGFSLVSPDPDANAILQEFWTSPVNDMESNVRIYVKDLCFYGELGVLVKVNPHTGFCGLTLIPSSQISDLEEKPGFPGEIRRLITRQGDAYDVIQWDNGAREYRGECFLHRINRLGGHVRGYPDLIPLLDWTRVFESFSYNKLERDAQQYGVWWDVKLEGKTEEEIQEYANRMGGNSPRAGSAIYHNEMVDWTLVQQKPAYAVSRDAEFFLNFILGGAGLIDLGITKDATGELLNPAINSMNCRQKDVYSFFTFIGRFVLQEAIRAGKLPGGKEYPISTVSQRLGVRDIQRSAGALLRISKSLEVAVDRGWISAESAKQVFTALLYRLDMVDAPATTSSDQEAQGVFRSQ